MPNHHIAHLRETIDQLQDATKHLKTSMRRCKKIDLRKKENAFIEFEALTARFARVVDMLIHKVYRSIDNVEFINNGGTLIDVMNRADKRGLIDSVEEMSILKDLRNDIAHEYVTEEIQQLHQDVLHKIPKLFELIGRAIDYCQRYS